SKSEGIVRTIVAWSPSSASSPASASADRPTTVKCPDPSSRATSPRESVDRSLPMRWTRVSRISNVAANDSTMSWTKGMASTWKSVARSRTTCRYSFQTRKRTVRISGQPDLEAARARHQQERRHSDQDERLLPQVRQTDALQHDPARDDQKPFRRDDVADPLEDRRHALDREDEPGEHERREEHSG